MTEPEIRKGPALSAEPACVPRVLPAPGNSVLRRWDFWRAVIWGEWYAHSRLILFFLGAWLLAAWVLPRLINPGWLLAFGCIYAFVAGPAMGGRDVLDGCEEYSFSLPATRAEWFWARWAIGAGILGMFTVLDLLALGLDLSQAVARFYLDTRLIEAKAMPHPSLLYGLTLAFPLACFTATFVLSANAQGRGLVLSSPLWGGLLALAVLRLGLLYEFWEWQRWTGYIACPALVFGAAGAAVAGAWRFGRKELVPPTRPWNMPSFWWAWILLVLGSLGLITFLVSSLGKELAAILGR